MTISIESEILRGIAEGEFDLAFQPQVSMTTGRMTGGVFLVSGTVGPIQEAGTRPALVALG
jgi:EAL domain-containing protein (putative c-di-GMP-specific phosphodiesterase class I)